MAYETKLDEIKFVLISLITSMHSFVNLVHIYLRSLYKPTLSGQFVLKGIICIIF